MSSPPPLISQTRAPQVRNDVPAKLLELYSEAVVAVERLNAALAAASYDSIRAADLPPRFALYAPESAYPIPCVLSKERIPRDPPIPHTRDSLAEEARRLGMSRAEVRRRFGLPDDDHAPLPRRQKPKPVNLEPPDEDLIAEVIRLLKE